MIVDGKEISKVFNVGEGSVLMNWEDRDARMFLIQAMFDETMRLKTATDKKEKDSIRVFLIESYRALSETGAAGACRAELLQDMPEEK